MVLKIASIAHISGIGLKFQLLQCLIFLAFSSTGKDVRKGEESLFNNMGEKELKIRHLAVVIII